MPMDLPSKLRAMLWDLPEDMKDEIVGQILSDPLRVFEENDELLLKALNSLRWYELTSLVGHQDLTILLSDIVIQKLFPAQRQTYYINAKRLLSKYVVSHPR